MDHANNRNHIIAANEGASIGLAAGYHLATGNIGLVYMQNSGLGNTVNPLTSLADREVYSIPILLIIGWRGEPGKKDEPQHVKNGRITLKLLDALEIPYEVLPDTMEEAKKSLEKAFKIMEESSAPYAFVVRKDTFEKYELMNNETTSYELSREDAIKLVINELGDKDIVVSTTGMASRELFEYREQLKQDHSRDFLTVGSMGHSSQIALGIALSKLNRQVFCLDGDGAVIMHMGSLGIIGSESPKNFKHVVINNGSHDSVGGQPTVAFDIDIIAIAENSGYKAVYRAETKEDLVQKLSLLKSTDGPAMLEVRVNKGHRKDLARPTTTPIENKESFMRFLSC